MKVKEITLQEYRNKFDILLPKEATIVLSNGLFFTDDDYIESTHIYICYKYHDSKMICYKYNTITEIVSCESMKIDALLSWITEKTIFHKQSCTVYSNYSYKYILEKHGSKSYRMTTEVKNHVIYYTIEEVTIFRGGKVW